MTIIGERDPADSQPVVPGQHRPLVAMVCSMLAATAVILGIMWMSNAHHDGAGARAVAESRSQ